MYVAVGGICALCRAPAASSKPICKMAAMGDPVATSTPTPRDPTSGPGAETEEVLTSDEEEEDDDDDAAGLLAAPVGSASSSAFAASQGRWAVVRAVLWSLLYVACWYSLSTCLSLFNKWFLGTQQYGFAYPLLLTSCHFFLQFALSAAVLALFCGRFRPTRPVTWAEYGARVVPSGVATALDIGLSNYSLVFLTLSFYTMCKSTAPIFLLGFAFLFRLERPSWQLAAVVAVVTVGLLLTVYGETQFDAIGFALVMSAAVMAGLRWTLTQVHYDPCIRACVCL
jgi:hypothetical protein